MHLRIRAVNTAGTLTRRLLTAVVNRSRAGGDFHAYLALSGLDVSQVRNGQAGSL